MRLSFLLTAAIGMTFTVATPNPVAASPATAAPTAAPPTALITQAFTGGGGGTIFSEPRFFPVWETIYSSSSQLGRGGLTWGSEAGPATDATLTRADGMTMHGSVVSSHDCDPYGAPNVCTAFDFTGGGDVAAAHVVLVSPDSNITTIPRTAFSFVLFGTLTLRQRIGYAMVGADGTVHTFGGVDPPAVAAMPGAIGVILDRAGTGGWVLNANAEVSTFGRAHMFNPFEEISLVPGERVTSFAMTPTERGYWVFTSRGRAVQFGNDTGAFGDMFGTRLNGPIVASIATPTGKGYYMVGSDGGVFAFGDAEFHGSMGATHLNAPVVGLVPTPTNKGYWLVASDGGVFSFGDAAFHGSTGGIRLNAPIVAMAPYADGYMMVASDGGVFNFSKGTFFGSLGGTPLAAPIVSAAAVG